MKVLQFVTHLNIGGITTYVYTLSKYLLKENIEVAIASSGGSQENKFKKLGIPIFKVKIRTKSELSPKIPVCLYQLYRLRKKFKFDLIHSHTRVSQVVSQLFRNLTAIPYVANFHGFYHQHKYHWQRRIFKAQGNRTIAITNYVKEDLIKFFNADAKKIKVIISGAFCEQPPVSLIKTIEMAGCYVVDDDMILGSRWIEGDVNDDTDDPLNALVEAYLTKSTFSSSVYDINNPKEDRLIELVEKRKADGIIFAAPSFCDPALLDRPLLQKACDDRNVRYISFKYSENTGQFKNIKEQVGAFADSIKLWSDELIES